MVESISPAHFESKAGVLPLLMKEFLGTWCWTAVTRPPFVELGDVLLLNFAIDVTRAMSLSWTDSDMDMCRICLPKDVIVCRIHRCTDHASLYPAGATVGNCENVGLCMLMQSLYGR